MKELTLIEELNAADNSFLIELLGKANWKHTALINLIEKFYEECQKRENDTMLSREIAGVVWDITDSIKGGNQHVTNNFFKEYYEKAYELIDDLVYHYFMGESLYIYKSVVEDKIREMKLFFI